MPRAHDHAAAQRSASTARTALVALIMAAALISPSGLGTAPAAAPAVARGGAVVSGHRLASEAGIEALDDGGNAVDAAVVTALALAVVYPEAGNLAGGGFAVVRYGGEVQTLDFRETAPAAARANMYLDERGQPIPDASLVGPLAAGVPGSPAGLHELHHRFGKLSWARVVAPAARLASAGFAVDQHLRELLGKANNRKLLGRFPESARTWLPGGEPPALGSLFRQPELAATLSLYAERGPAAIVGGTVAAAVETAARRHGGILTAADLASYRAVWQRPLTFEAYGWKLAAMDLPSSGGIILAQTLGILERLGWEKLPRFGADRDHLLAETFRRAFADRFLLGDPASTRATAAQLLDPRWIAARADGIDRRHATPSSQVRHWTEAAAAARAESSETAHLSTVDGEGNLVALTTTLNGLFGCGLYVPEIGFLNNEMDDFATAPGRPNVYGLVQGEANAVGAGKRMLSAMTPVIAWRGGESFSLGGRGGSRIPSHTAQVLINLLVDLDPLQLAVDRPRLHHQWLPDRLEAETGALSAATRAELERRGHAIFPGDDTAARVHAVHRLAGGRVEAAVDPRGAAAVGGAAVLAPGK
jgi:gamma-glutamyltranspeptidase / glutathione hydrolase